MLSFWLSLFDDSIGARGLDGAGMARRAGHPAGLGTARQLVNVLDMFVASPLQKVQRMRGSLHADSDQRR
jgi:hypothetical protein